MQSRLVFGDIINSVWVKDIDFFVVYYSWALFLLPISNSYSKCVNAERDSDMQRVFYTTRPWSKSMWYGPLLSMIPFSRKNSHLSAYRLNIQIDSKLLSEFPFIGLGNPENNVESHCISACQPAELNVFIKKKHFLKWLMCIMPL
jgi:hypothetical protein